MQCKNRERVVTNTNKRVTVVPTPPTTILTKTTMMPPENTSMTVNTMAMPAPEVEAQLKIVQLQYYFN